MIASPYNTRLAAPVLSFMGLILGLVILPGCDADHYSEDLIYPVRDDPVVEQAPATDPPGFERPGQWAYQLPVFDEKGGKKYDVAKLTADQRGAFQKLLNERFGTPAKPAVKGIDDEARSKLFLAKDEDELKRHLAAGSQLYRRHCLHCHGLTGDGHGPTAPWVNPHPRDYRAGKFKFMSVMGGTLGDKARKPTRADLIRTLKQGIEGTSMPTFGLLPEEQLNDLVSYVIHLSLRGNLEYQLVRFVFGEDPDNPSKVAVAPMISDAESTLGEIVQEWAKAEGEPIPADSFPAGAENLNSAEGQASIQRGHRLFLGLGVNQASCVSCHADYGRQITFKYDEWGTVVRPRDLTAGIYRGGRRPIDLYYRIFSGIHGTPMPAFAGENGPKRNRDIWDLVNFVRALPYPGMLPEEVRNQIYPEKAGQTRAALAQRD